MFRGCAKFIGSFVGGFAGFLGPPIFLSAMKMSCNDFFREYPNSEKTCSELIMLFYAPYLGFGFIGTTIVGMMIGEKFADYICEMPEHVSRIREDLKNRISYEQVRFFCYKHRRPEYNDYRQISKIIRGYMG